MAASAIKPIFIVGSPRSGTSILTWCLGQHSNILVQEESNWLGRFSLDVESAYRTGTFRGERSQLFSLGVRREVFFAKFGQAINDLILEHRQELTRVAMERALAAPDRVIDVPAFQFERSDSDPKKRWVDGTPEYSFYICGLRKLFPEAVFIHVLRRARPVVGSILHFSKLGAQTLAKNEERAYDYWLRCVRACQQAERAYGSNVVRRVFHADLVAQPENTMRNVLEFLHEPFEPACLEPLSLRINSSEVPADFESSDSATDKKVMEAAAALEAELLNDDTPLSPSPEAVADLEATFDKLVRDVRDTSDYKVRSKERIAKLEIELRRQTEQRSTPVHRSRWRKWRARKNA